MNRKEILEAKFLDYHALIIEHIDQAACLLDVEANVLAFNTSMKQILFDAYQLELEQGINLLTGSMRSAAEIVQCFEKVTKSNETCTSQRKQAVGEEFFICEDRFKPIINNGEIQYVLFTSRDVTKPVRDSQLLKITNDKAKIGGWQFINRTEKLIGTEQAYALFNVTNDEEFSLRKAMATFHPDDKPRVEKKLVELIQTGKPMDEVARLIPRSGELRWVHTKAYLESTDSGDLDRIIGLIQDITEQKKLDLLIESNNLAKIGAWDYDMESGKSRLSPGVYDIYAISRDTEMSLEDTVVYYHPDDRALLVDSFQLLSKYGRPYDLELRLTNAKGDKLWVKVIAEVDMVAGKPVRFYGSIQDITVRKEAELALAEVNRSLEAKVSERTQELELANQELETYSYMLSHDLRTPMRAMSMFQELLSRSMTDTNEKQQEFFAYMKEALSDMEVLVADANDFIKLRGKQANKEEVNWDVYLDYYITRLKHANQGIDIHVDIPSLPVSNIDTRLFAYVVRNLLGNAVSYRKEGEPVKITIAAKIDKDTKTEEIVITDNGIGLPAGQEEAIFKPYVRLKKKPAVKGSGLGLAIVARIINMHGGTIRAQSDGSSGTSFIIRLPLF